MNHNLFLLDFERPHGMNPGMSNLVGVTPISSRSSSPSIAIPQHQRSTSSSLLMGGPGLFPLSTSQNGAFQGEISSTMSSPRSNMMAPPFSGHSNLESQLDLGLQSSSSVGEMGGTPLSMSPSLGEPFGLSALYPAGTLEDPSSPPLFSKSWSNNSMNYPTYHANAPFGSFVDGAAHNSLSRPSGVIGTRSRTLTEGALTSRHLPTSYGGTAQSTVPSSFMGFPPLDSLVEDPSRQ